MLTVSDPSRTDWANMPLKAMAYGNAMDSYFTLLLYNKLKIKLIDVGLYEHYKNLVCPLNSVLAKVELRGMKIDQTKLEEVGNYLSETAEEAKKLIFQFPQVPSGTNLNSTDDLANILFLNENGFKLYPPFRTKKTNSPQVDKNALETIEFLIEEELEKRKHA